MAAAGAPLLETRRYLEIQPADESLSPAAVTNAVAELHGLRPGGRGGSSDVPTYEVLLVATGRSSETGQRSLSWFVGLDEGTGVGDDGDASDHDLDLDQVRRTLGGCLGNADITITEQSYAELLELPVVAAADEATPTTSTATATATATAGPTTATDHSRTHDREDAATTERVTTAVAAAVDAVPTTGRAVSVPGSGSGSGSSSSSSLSSLRAHIPSPANLSWRSLGTRLLSTARDVYGPPPEPSTPPLAAYDVASVEFVGVGRRPADWQYPLSSIESVAGDAGAWPLARICDRLAAGDAPTLLQLLVRPTTDYTAALDARYTAIARGEDLWRHELADDIWGFFLDDTDDDAPDPNPTRSGEIDPDLRASISAAKQRRLEALQTAEGSESFTVNARAIAFGTDDEPDVPEATLRPLVDALDGLEDTYYRVAGSFAPYGSTTANDVLEAILQRDVATSPTRRRHRVPVVPNWSPAIVMEPGALASVMVTDATALSSAARRAIEATPRERTGIELPAHAALAPYLERDGQAIGRPRTVNREPLDATVSVPPAVQQLHTGVFGASGGGKSVLGRGMALENHVATEGAEIIVDSKGDGGPAAFLRAYFAAHGDLESVYYFDCSEVLPALPVLSIEPQLDSGVDRYQAVQNIVQGYMEMLAGYMGDEQFYSARASVTLIELLLKAQFDPEYGSDATSQSELLATLGRLYHTGDPPAVSVDEIEAGFEQVMAYDDGSVDNVVAGAADRLRKATADGRLRPLLEHTATGNGTAGESDAWFDLREHLDEDCVIILDISDYREQAQRLLTLLFVSELWTALNRRTTTTTTVDPDASADTQPATATATDDAAPPVDTQPATATATDDPAPPVDTQPATATATDDAAPPVDTEPATPGDTDTTTAAAAAPDTASAAAAASPGAPETAAAADDTAAATPDAAACPNGRCDHDAGGDGADDGTGDGEATGDGPDEATADAAGDATADAAGDAASDTVDDTTTDAAGADSTAIAGSDALPTVNLYLEEAADVATSDNLAELLAKGRSFGVGVTVMMQFPQQVRESHPRVFRELINDIGTHVTGPVNDPGDLATPFATAAHPTSDMEQRIAGLARGEWLVRPAAAFGAERPTPFVCESPPLPAGHPDGDDPLTGSDAETYQARRTCLDTRMLEYGLPVPETTAAAAQPRQPDGDAGGGAGSTEADAETALAGAVDSLTGTGSPDVASVIEAMVNPILHTDRLPGCVTYVDTPPYPLECASCDTRFAATRDGMRRAIRCCHDLASVDRDDVPICSLDLALTPAELRASEYTAAQLRLLAAVYMAHQRRFDPTLEYDLVTDSSIRLREYVGADSDDVAALREDGLLTRDCTKPHYLYTVTPAGRAELQVGHREGIAHGDGKGDLSESSLHVAMTETLARYVHQAYVAPPDATAVRVKRYHEVDVEVADGRGRLDVAALDADGDVVVAGEAELINNDRQRAIPGDFDTMAACEPDAAIWIVKNRAAATTVLEALHDPLEGEPRVGTSGSRNRAPQNYRIETPGLTDIYTFEHVRDTLLEAPRPGPRALEGH